MASWSFLVGWLVGEALQWPARELDCLSPDCRMLVLNNAVVISPVGYTSAAMVELERFSSLAKLLRVVTYVFRFAFCLKKVSSNPSLAAGLHLLKVEQSLCLTKEKLFLLNPFSSEVPFLVASLTLFLDEEELIRSKDRICKSEFPFHDVLFPILLPRFSRLTELVFMACYVKCKHLDIAATLCKLRLSGLGVHKTRQRIKAVISSYSLCKKYNAISLKEYPKVTNLLKHRVNFVRSFLHTGIDFTGHLRIQVEGDRKKIYILLFTYQNIRTIHQELVKDMPIHSVVLALVQFFYLYRVPSHILTMRVSLLLVATW